MTRFVPHSIELEPRRRLEEVDEGLLRACFRRFAWLSFSPVRLLVLGLASGGALVAMLMARRLWRLVVLENQKLALMANRVEHHAGTAGVSELDGRLSQVVPNLRRSWLMLVVAALLSVATALLFVGVAWTNWREAFAPLLPWLALPGSVELNAPGLALHACSLLAFAALSVAIVDRRRGLGRFVSAWNGVSAARGIPELRLPRRWLGWPGWHALIVVMALIGPTWSVPMGLAGWLMVGYIRGTSDVLFVQMGQALRAMLAASSDGVFIPPVPGGLWRCEDAGCGVLRPEGVPCCPRCGRAASTGRQA